MRLHGRWLHTLYEWHNEKHIVTLQKPKLNFYYKGIIDEMLCWHRFKFYGKEHLV